MCEVIQKVNKKQQQKLVAQVRQASKTSQANVSSRTINKNGFEHKNGRTMVGEKTDEQH